MNFGIMNAGTDDQNPAVRGDSRSSLRAPVPAPQAKAQVEEAVNESHVSEPKKFSKVRNQPKEASGDKHKGSGYKASEDKASRNKVDDGKASTMHRLRVDLGKPRELVGPIGQLVDSPSLSTMLVSLGFATFPSLSSSCRALAMALRAPDWRLFLEERARAKGSL